MTCVYDKDKHGTGALRVEYGDTKTICWIRDRKDGRCSAWVCWDGVTYLACKSAENRDIAAAEIYRWIETMTGPDSSDSSLLAALVDPWRASTTPHS